VPEASKSGTNRQSPVAAALPAAQALLGGVSDKVP
jgi:hypothetical protein